MRGLSIIFVNYKSKGLVRQNLLALESGEHAHTFEVIVVDNDSRDGTAALLQSRFRTLHVPLKVLSLPQNRGFAAGVNRGIEHSRFDRCLILNPDIVVTQAALEQLEDFMESHPDAGIAGPRLLQPDGEIQPSCFAFPTFFTPFYRRTLLKHLPPGKKKPHLVYLESEY